MSLKRVDPKTGVWEHFIKGEWLTTKQVTAKYAIPRGTIQSRLHGGMEGDALIVPMTPVMHGRLSDRQRSDAYIQAGMKKTPRTVGYIREATPDEDAWFKSRSQLSFNEWMEARKESEIISPGPSTMVLEDDDDE